MSLNRYTYCHNQPVTGYDPDGRFFNWIGGAVGAIAGTIIGAGASIISQGVTKGFNKISWRSVGGSAADGALIGGAAGLTSGASLLPSITAGVTAGAAGNVLNQGISKGFNKIDPKEVAVSAAAGGAGFGAANVISKTAVKVGGNVAVKLATKTVAKAGADAAIKAGAKAGSKVVANAVAGGIIGGTAGLGSDVARQATSITLGSQKKYSPLQTITSTVAGGALGAGMGALTTKATGGKGSSKVRERKGSKVTPIDKNYDMALDPEYYANTVAKRYGINLRGSGQDIKIKFNPTLKCAGKSRQNTPNIIEIGPSALVSEDELANTIAHELNHARSWLRSGNAPENTAYDAGDALSNYINGGR